MIYFKTKYLDFIKHKIQILCLIVKKKSKLSWIHLIIVFSKRSFVTKGKRIL